MKRSVIRAAAAVARDVGPHRLKSRRFAHGAQLRHGMDDIDPPVDSPPVAPGHPRGTLGDVLRGLPGRLPNEETTIGEILEALGDRATALILLLFSLPAIIPTPGVPAGLIYGVVLAVLAVQLIAGGGGHLVPPWLARRRVRRSHFAAIITRALPWVDRAGGLTKPRWPAFTSRRALPPIGLAILVMAVIIIMPIPFGNTLPGITVS